MPQFKSLPCAAEKIDEDRYSRIVAARHKEFSYIFSAKPDSLAYRHLENGRIELLLMQNTRPYVVQMTSRIFDNLYTSVEAGATFEEICYMLDLPR